MEGQSGGNAFVFKDFLSKPNELSTSLDYKVGTVKD